MDTSKNSETADQPASNNDFSSSALDLLQSKEQLELFDEIDKLRSHGVHEFVSLPQLVVCGDQSAGKSSVLEAITEIPFPRQDTLCTRFATQIVLRRAEETNAEVTIIPGRDRTKEERARLSEFRSDMADLGELPTIIESAKKAMGINTGSSNFSKDILSIVVHGPKRPQLTLVDLPGLIHVSKEGSEDVNLVRELAHNYMKDPRTIALAVVSAGSDWALQEILENVRAHDKFGARTLGIITKPDNASIGSETEKAYVELARNERYPLELGWHILRNRKFEERNSTFEQRNKTEEEFFSRGVWKTLPKESVGIAALRTRLSTLLHNHIKKELPRVLKEAQDRLKTSRSDLDKLGVPRSTFEAQREYTFRLADSFNQVCKAAVEGSYESPFFTGTSESDTMSRRLRAKIQQLNLQFAERMRSKGHEWEILDSDSDTPPSAIRKSSAITRQEAIRKFKPYIVQSRGRELQGSYNPLLIGELFRMQSARWDDIARQHVQNVLKACYDFIELALRDLTVEHTKTLMFYYHINGKLNGRKEKATTALDGYISDRQEQPITYNHHYVEAVSDIRQQRMKELIRQSMQSYETDYNNGTLAFDKIVAMITHRAESQMEDHACGEIIDCMLAYYKVALRTFVDNVAANVVERQVVSRLWDVLAPLDMMRLDHSKTSIIAAEPKEIQEKRAQLDNQCQILERGLTHCILAQEGLSPDSRVNLIDTDEFNQSNQEEELDASTDSSSTTSTTLFTGTSTPAKQSGLFPGPSALGSLPNQPASSIFPRSPSPADKSHAPIFPAFLNSGTPAKQQSAAAAPSTPAPSILSTKKPGTPTVVSSSSAPEKPWLFSSSLSSSSSSSSNPAVQSNGTSLETRREGPGVVDSRNGSAAPTVPLDQLAKDKGSRPEDLMKIYAGWQLGKASETQAHGQGRRLRW